MVRDVEPGVTGMWVLTEVVSVEDIIQGACMGRSGFKNEHLLCSQSSPRNWGQSDDQGPDRNAPVHMALTSSRERFRET